MATKTPFILFAKQNHHLVIARERENRMRSNFNGKEQARGQKQKTEKAKDAKNLYLIFSLMHAVA